MQSVTYGNLNLFSAVGVTLGGTPNALRKDNYLIISALHKTSAVGVTFIRTPTANYGHKKRVP